MHRACARKKKLSRFPGQEKLVPHRVLVLLWANGIDEKRLSRKQGNVKVFHFSGARIEDINLCIIPIIKKQPDYLILDVRTKVTTTNTSKKIVDDLLTLKSNISKQLPSCRIVLSKPIIRHDNGKANLTILNVNKHLSAIQSECIENDNISTQHLGWKGLQWV